MARKKVLSLCVASALLFCALTAVAQDADARHKATNSQALNWTSDLKKGLNEAKSSNKLVLADVYTDWCGWCKTLDRTTFVDPDFVKYASANFVCVRCNAEDNGEGTKAAQENKVTGFPTALVYDGDGKVIGRVYGFKNAKEYQEALEQIIKNKR